MFENKESTKALTGKFVLFTVFFLFYEIGLPNSILGTAWPAIRVEMGLPLEHIGFLNIALLISSMFACIFSGFIIARFGTGITLLVATIFFILTMNGVYFLNSFIGLVIILIPIGYSMGTIDSGSNLFVSLNYESRHMSLLHCCWGAGALTGPIIMVTVIAAGYGWRGCFVVIGVMCIAPFLLVVRSSKKRYWDNQPKRVDSNSIKKDGMADERHINKRSSKRTQFFSIIIFFIHTGSSTVLSSLISSYMDEMWGTPLKFAGFTVTIFLASVTVSRMITGIVVEKTGNLMMIRGGLIIATIGCAIAFLTKNESMFQMSFVIIGLGTGPLFPCLIHETPIRFTDKVAKRLVGYQIAAAQVGGSLVSMAVAVFLSRTSMRWMMAVEVVLYLLVFVFNEIVVKTKK